jgi:hypothetical protein
MPENARKCPIVFCQMAIFCLNIADIGHGFDREAAKGAKSSRNRRNKPRMGDEGKEQ